MYNKYNGQDVRKCIYDCDRHWFGEDGGEKIRDRGKAEKRQRRLILWRTDGQETGNKRKETQKNKMKDRKNTRNTREMKR